MCPATAISSNWWGIQASGNRYRYSTKEWQQFTNLYDYGLRFYSPALGRWINRDPIRERGGLNLYAMVGNSPTNYGDEFGLSPYLSDPTKKPPGWNEDWNTGNEKNGKPYSEDPETGERWYPHHEDEGHWPHYDRKGGGRYPEDSSKQRPNQVGKRPKPGQSLEDPWPQSCPVNDPTTDPIVSSPGWPSLPDWAPPVIGGGLMGGAIIAGGIMFAPEITIPALVIIAL